MQVDGTHVVQPPGIQVAAAAQGQGEVTTLQLSMSTLPSPVLVNPEPIAEFEDDHLRLLGSVGFPSLSGSSELVIFLPSTQTSPLMMDTFRPPARTIVVPRPVLMTPPLIDTEPPMTILLLPNGT